MTDEVYIKNIELADSRKASIKSKWRKHEDRVEVEIYVKDDSIVYTGSCSLDELRKKKEDINVEFDTIKNSITSGEDQPNIRYELDEKKLNFTVVAQEQADSDASIDAIIYLKLSLKNVESTQMVSVLMKTVDEMLESLQQAAKVNSERAHLQDDLNALQKLYDDTIKEKEEFDNTIYHRFNALLKSKKKRIVELERRLEKSDTPNKFLNLSSDLDQSDKDRSSIEKTKVLKTTPKKRSPSVGSSESSDDAIESQKPSTSKSFRSPARRKPSFRNDSPRTGSKKKNSPRAGTQRTPQKLSLSPRKSLFQFKSSESNDSEDDPKPLSFKVYDNLFSGLSIKITPKDCDSQENQSSAELFIPTSNSMKRLDFSSPEANEQRSSAFVQPAQVIDMDEDYHSEKSQKDENNSQDLPVEEPFTQNYDDEIRENSQPLSQSNESPSIFDTFPKRKLPHTPDPISKRTRLRATKSKFSVDTVNILNDSF